MKTQTEYLTDLRERGFAAVEDSGTAVIVIGQRDQIPTDRVFSVFDLMVPTRARRFESAKEAVRVLIPKMTTA